MPDLFLKSRLYRLPVKRSDVVHVFTQRLQECDREHIYGDTCFRAAELAEAGDALEAYLNGEAAVDKEEITSALLSIDTTLKGLFDALESALSAEVQHV